ncbi:hypothetical protein SLIQ_02765 [Serratia liquefaciens FK01]|nr:hypothetical protein SLIQ_02765 [Serratia liquefaciens FK01]
MRLDFTAGANADVFLDFDKGPDEHSVTESAAVQIAGLNDGDILPGDDIDDAGLADSNGG